MGKKKVRVFRMKTQGFKELNPLYNGQKEDTKRNIDHSELTHVTAIDAAPQYIRSKHNHRRPIK